MIAYSDNKNTVFANIQDSSVIKACSYKKDLKRLNVTFSNGNIYSFEGVTYARFLRLVGAKSVGKYFAEKIKGKYISSKRTFVVENEAIRSLGRSFR